MADQSISIRLAVTDGGKVKAELVDIGASGQKALERIRDAAQPASRGLQALDAAGGALRGKMQEMAGSAGAFGTALRTLGPAGLAAAAGVGAITAAIGFAIIKAREAIDHFSALNDQAARIGMSVEGFQSLTYAFGAIGVDAEQTEKAFTKLNDAIGKVLEQGADAPTEVKQAFDALGISMADVQKHGDDLDWMIAAMAEGFSHLTTTAEKTIVAKALMGREAAKLVPLLEQGAAKLREEQQAAADAGAVLGKDLVEHLDRAGDRLDALDKVMAVQSARTFGDFADIVVEARQTVADLWVGLNDLLDAARQELGPSVFDDIAKAAWAPRCRCRLWRCSPCASGRRASCPARSTRSTSSPAASAATGTRRAAPGSGGRARSRRRTSGTRCSTRRGRRRPRTRRSTSPASPGGTASPAQRGVSSTASSTPRPRSTTP
jgi:hypothetical protein